jgi:hypothetical protein
MLNSPGKYEAFFLYINASYFGRGTNSTKRKRMKKRRKNKAQGYQYGKIKLHTSKYLENINCNLYYLQALRMRDRFIRDVPVIFLCKKKKKKKRKKKSFERQ